VPVDERIVDPQEERELAARDRVEVLEQQQRDERAADADFDEQRPDLAAEHFRSVFTAVSAIFRGATVDLDTLTAGLSADERAAIAMLHEAIEGRDPNTQQLVYAEQRLAMLNQVLAVLQPTLAQALAPALDDLRGEYDVLVEEVHTLRDRLENLDSAQEEIFEQDRKKEEEEGKPEPPPEDEGKPGEPAEEAEPEAETDAEDQPSTLYGDDEEAAVEPPVTKSTVWEP